MVLHSRQRGWLLVAPAGWPAAWSSLAQAGFSRPACLRARRICRSVVDMQHLPSHRLAQPLNCLVAQRPGLMYRPSDLGGHLFIGLALDEPHHHKLSHGFWKLRQFVQHSLHLFRLHHPRQRLRFTCRRFDGGPVRLPLHGASGYAAS